jgi:hypothetical protein
MKKEVVLIVIGLFLLVSAGVLAQTISEEQTGSEDEIDIDADTEEYIKDFVNKGNIAKQEEVNKVSQINQSKLPQDVEIKNIEENKVGIYEVNYTKEGQQKKVFVVTYATSQLKVKETAITKNVQNMYFGFTGISSKDSYLETGGVSLNGEKGYVMLREGSITGISTSLDLSGSGKVFISVFKNGENTGFHNLIDTENSKKIDFDLQSEEIVSYSPGDVISVYVETSGNVNWGNVVTTVETTS